MEIAPPTQHSWSHALALKMGTLAGYRRTLYRGSVSLVGPQPRQISVVLWLCLVTIAVQERDWLHLKGSQILVIAPSYTACLLY
jgi:hypothetical protein